MTELNDKQIRILQVAERLFAEKGFDGTSIRDISREAGSNIAMVSYYFGSKEKMLEALILHRIRDMRLQLENLMRENLSPPQKMERLVDLYLERVNKNRCIYQIVQFELASNKRKLDMKQFLDVKKQNLACLEQIVREGQEQGLFRKDVNITLLPSTLIGTYFHFQANRPLYEDLLDLNTDARFETYVTTELASHIKQTINALLLP